MNSILASHTPLSPAHSASLASQVAIALIAAFMIAAPCFAQDGSSFDSAHTGSPTIGAAPQLPGAINGTLGPQGTDLPQLRGVNNGTIGPPGGDYPVSPNFVGSPAADATVISGVMTAGTVRVPQQRVWYKESPWLCAIIPLLAFGTFMLLRKKNSSITELGIVASIVVVLSGMAWGLAVFAF